MNRTHYTDLDLQIAQELAAFVPTSVFDFHAHVLRQVDLHLEDPSPVLPDLAEVSIPVWREQISPMFPTAHLCGGLFIPYPSVRCDIDHANEWLIQQLNIHPDSRGLVLITPRCSRNRLAAYLAHPQVAGFKPYHFFAGRKDTLQADIADYLPEVAWQLADERHLVIMLHLVKDRALADSENRKQIAFQCRKYPAAKLVLAHAARSFHAPNIVNGIDALKELPNVWFDTSAICEPLPLFTVLQHFGPGRLLWGSDFPISSFRGKCVTVGDGFVWLDARILTGSQAGGAPCPTIVGLESLRALKEASVYFHLPRGDLQDIFCNNALRLLGFPSEPPENTDTRITQTP